jgi:hypothetical protein
MSDDRIRAAFRKADASLGYAPPDLEQTLRKARRDDIRMRIFATVGVAVIISVAVFGGARLLRPDPPAIVPIAGGSPAPGPTASPVPAGPRPVR